MIGKVYQVKDKPRKATGIKIVSQNIKKSRILY